MPKIDPYRQLDTLRDRKTGALERPIGARPLAVPLEVLVEGDRIRWRTPEYDPSDGPIPKHITPEERARLLGKPREARPARRMLEDFVRLHRGTDQDIRDYAAKWGPLGICRHGFPHTHWPLAPWDVVVRPFTPEEREQRRGRAPDGLLPCYKVVEMAVHSGTAEQLAEVTGDTSEPELALIVNRSFCQPLGHVEEKGRGGWEPLERWRYFSEEAALILKTASSLHLQGNGWASIPASEADRLLYGGASPAQNPSSPAETDVHWDWVRTAVDRWLNLGNVRPYLHDFGKGNLSVGYGTSDSPTEADLYVGPLGFFFENVCGLFGALATQLMLAAVNQPGWTNCQACGLPFYVDRVPAPGKHAWCWDPKCRRAKNADAQRRSRSRKSSLE